MADDVTEEAVKPRKAPATIMKEKIEALEAENARLKALAESPVVEAPKAAEAPAPARTTRS